MTTDDQAHVLVIANETLAGRELIGAVGASPNGAFEAVQKFKRFLQTQMATHNRSSRYV